MVGAKRVSGEVEVQGRAAINGGGEYGTCPVLELGGIAFLEVASLTAEIDAKPGNGVTIRVVGRKCTSDASIFTACSVIMSTA